MKKALGILVLLLVVIAVTGFVNPKYYTPNNVQNLLRWTGLYGVISIGVAFVIITGGIDLSIGSVVCLVGCLLPWLLAPAHAWHPAAGIAAVLGVAVAVGLTHGLLITKMRLQPFVVTLCGLLIYRGIARYFTRETQQGFGNSFPGLREIAVGKIELPLIAANRDHYAIPYTFLIMLGLALAAGFFLNQTVFGRYLFALGRNEQAARFSGINTDRMTILAYVICSLMAGLGGILFALDINSVQPASHGNFYELYAIAAAVLGGCSLRGGEGTIMGVVFGSALIRQLLNSIGFLGVQATLEPAIVGAVILIGVIADEVVGRLVALQRAKPQAGG